MKKVIRVVLEFDADEITQGDLFQLIDAILFNGLPAKLNRRGMKAETVEAGAHNGKLT